MSEDDIEPALADALRGLPDDFKNFDRVFAEKLRPELQKMEVLRQKAAPRAKQGYIRGGVLGVVGALAEMLLFSQPILAGLSVIAGIGIAAYMSSDLRKLAGQAKSFMVTPIAREFGLEYLEAPGVQPSIRDFRAAGLLPGWDREGFEDKLTGERDGVPFEFFEAHLEDKRTRTDSNGRTRTEWVTVFRGQCLRFGFHKTFYGRTLVARDAGLFNRFGGGSGMNIAKLEDPVFEKIFSVYTTDQVESRFLLTPDLMQRFVDLEETFRGGSIRCCFVGGEILIVIANGDMFEPGSLFTPLDNPERIRELLDDFAAVFHLIDATSEQRGRKG